MSFFIVDPDATVPVNTFLKCPAHANSTKSWTEDRLAMAMCTCSASFGSRPATADEYRQARVKRLTARKAEIESELQSIITELANPAVSECKRIIGGL